MDNLKYFITFIGYIFVINQYCYGQQISYLTPSKGNKIYKYKINIGKGGEINDSILLARYTFNSKGFCVENYQFETNTKSSFIYKDDTLLISSKFDGGIMDNNPLNSETLNFYNKKNQLIKTEIINSGSLNTTVEYKYNKKQYIEKEIIKSFDNKPIGYKKRFYKDRLLVMEVYRHSDGNLKSFTHFSYNDDEQIKELYHGRTAKEKVLDARYIYKPNGIIIKKDMNSCEDIIAETIYDSSMNILSEIKHQNGQLISQVNYHYSLE